MTSLTIDVTRAVVDRTLCGPTRVIIDDGIITAIQPFAGATRNVTLVPGFVDLQVNGIDDVDVATASGKDWERLDHLLVAQGTTTWLPTLISAPLDTYCDRFVEIAAAQQRAEARPAIAGVHLEGPFLGSLPGAHVPSSIVEPDLAWVAALPRAVSMMTIGAESELTAELVAALVRNGVLVSLGHTAATAEQARSAFARGAAMVTHGFNAMSGLHHRNPGVVGATLAHESAAMSLIADLVHVSSDALRIAATCLGDDRLVLVTDAVAWRSHVVGDVAFVFDGIAPRLTNGTLAGSALTMDRAVRNMYGVVGIDLVTVIRAAATTPARLLGLGDRGIVSVGLRADVVALDNDLCVEETWIAGTSVYQRSTQ